MNNMYFDNTKYNDNHQMESSNVSLETYFI